MLVAQVRFTIRLLCIPKLDTFYVKIGHSLYHLPLTGEADGMDLCSHLHQA